MVLGGQGSKGGVGEGGEDWSVIRDVCPEGALRAATADTGEV